MSSPPVAPPPPPLEADFGTDSDSDDESEDDAPPPPFTLATLQAMTATTDAGFNPFTRAGVLHPHAQHPPPPPAAPADDFDTDSDEEAPPPPPLPTVAEVQVPTGFSSATLSPATLSPVAHHSSISVAHHSSISISSSSSRYSSASLSSTFSSPRHSSASFSPSSSPSASPRPSMPPPVVGAASASPPLPGTRTAAQVRDEFAALVRAKKEIEARRALETRQRGHSAVGAPVRKKKVMIGAATLRPSLDQPLGSLSRHGHSASVQLPSMPLTSPMAIPSPPPSSNNTNFTPATTSSSSSVSSVSSASTSPPSMTSNHSRVSVSSPVIAGLAFDGFNALSPLPQSSVSHSGLVTPPPDLVAATLAANLQLIDREVAPAELSALEKQRKNQQSKDEVCSVLKELSTRRVAPPSSASASSTSQQDGAPNTVVYEEYEDEWEYEEGADAVMVLWDPSDPMYQTSGAAQSSAAAAAAAAPAAPAEVTPLLMMDDDGELSEVQYVAPVIRSLTPPPPPVPDTAPPPPPAAAAVAAPAAAAAAAVAPEPASPAPAADSTRVIGGAKKVSAKALALMHGKTLRQLRPLDLASMLRTNIGYRFMLIQCYREYSEENVLAFKVLEAYAKHPSLVALQSAVDKYIRPTADLMINISSAVRKDIIEFLARYLKLQREGVSPLPDLAGVLSGAHREILELLGRDSFKRFQASALYVAYVSGAQPPTVLKRAGDVDQQDDIALIATVSSQAAQNAKETYAKK